MAGAAAATETPTTINDRFRVVKELGRGGMGRVYLVSDSDRDGQLLALKTLLPQTTDHLLTTGFREEFGQLAKVRHPNLAAAYDFGRVSRTKEFFFTTEFIKGVDLLDGTKEATIDQLLDITTQLLRGLDFIHNLGLLHNDLKPANILLAETRPSGDEQSAQGNLQKLESLVFGHSGRVKIIDFGLICREHTVCQKILGTLRYISPDRIRKDPADRRSDLYSLGVVLYVILTRYYPFDHSDVHTLLKMHLEDPAPPVQGVRADLPDALAELVHRLLEKRPDDRFPNAAAALDFLNNSLAGGAAHVTRRGGAQLAAGALLHRGAELNTLVELYERARSGTAQDHCLLIQGTAGVGKSRLVEEMRGHVQLSGGVYAGVSGTAVEGSLQPILDAIVGGLKTSGVAGVDRIQKEIAREVMSGASTLAESLERWILSYTQEVPMLLHLDDFDRASDAIYRFAVELVHSASVRSRKGECPCRLLLVLCRRVSEHGGQWRISGIPTLEVPKFDAQQSKEFVFHVFSQEDIPSATLDAMVKLSRGNPLFLLELANNLVRRGEVVVVGARWRFPDSLEGISLPESLTHLFEEKLRTLRSGSLEVLYWVAIAGEPVPHDLLKRCMEHQGAAVDEMLSELIQKNLVVSQRRGDSVEYVLAHAGSRDLLAKKLAKQQLRGLHKRFAQHIEEVLSESPSRSETLARHWLEAGNDAGFLRFGLEAAEVLRQRGDIETAVSYHQRLVRATPDTASAKKVQSLAKLSEMHEFLWDLDACRLDLLEIERVGFALMKPLDRALLLRRLGCVEVARQRNERAAELFASALGHLGAAPPPLVQAAVEAPRAWALWFDQKHEGARRAIETAERILATCPDGAGAQGASPRDRLLRIGAATSLANLFHQLGQLEKARQLYAQNLAALEGSDQRQAECATHCCLGSLLFEMGRYKEALDHLRRSQDLGKEIGDRRVLCKARDRLGDYHLRFGRLREALLAAQVGLEDAEKLKNPTATANSLQTLGRIYLTTDQIEDARGVFQKAVELRGEGVEVLSRELGRVHLIRLLIEEGQSQQADELLAGCERSARECQLPLLDAQTKLWSFVNSWKKARQLRPELIAEARRLLEQHGYREALLELMLAHANVCVEAGRPGEAQGLLDELDGLRQDSENPDLSLECDYLRAWLLVAKDAAPAKAFILLREARKTAHNRSKMRLARRCQALLDTVQPLVRRGDPSEG